MASHPPLSPPLCILAFLARSPHSFRETRSLQHMADKQKASAMTTAAATSAAPSPPQQRHGETSTFASRSSSSVELEDPEQEDALSVATSQATAAAAAVSASGKKLMNAAPAQVKSLMSRFSTPFGRKKAAAQAVVSDSVAVTASAPPASTPSPATMTTVKVVEEAPKSAPTTINKASTEATAVVTEATVASGEASTAVVTKATVVTSVTEDMQEEEAMTTTQEVAQESVETTTTATAKSVEEAVDDVAVSVELAVESAVLIDVSETVETAEEAVDVFTASTRLTDAEEAVDTSSTSVTATTTEPSTGTEAGSTVTATAVDESEAVTVGTIVVEDSASTLEVTEELKTSSDAVVSTETEDSISADSMTTEEPTPSPVKISIASAELVASTPVKESAPGATNVPIASNTEIEMPKPSPFKDIRNRFEVKKEQSLDNLPFRTVRSFFSEEERSVRVGAERQKYNALTEQQSLDAKIADEKKGKVKSPIAEDLGIKRVVLTGRTAIEGGTQAEARPAKKEFNSIVSRFEVKKDQSLDNLPFRTVRSFFSEEERSVRVGAERQKYNALTEQQSQAKIADEKKKPKQKEEAAVVSAATTSSDAVVVGEATVTVVAVEKTQEINSEEVAATIVVTSEDSGSIITVSEETVEESTVTVATEGEEIKSQDEASVVTTNEEITSTVAEDSDSVTVEETTAVELQEMVNETTAVATSGETASTIAVSERSEPVIAIEETVAEAVVVASVESAAVAEEIKTAEIVAETQEHMTEDEATVNFTSVEPTVTSERAEFVAAIEQITAETSIETEAIKTTVESIGSGTTDETTSVVIVSEKEKSVTAIDGSIAEVVLTELKPEEESVPVVIASEEAASTTEVSETSESAAEQDIQTNVEINGGTIGTMQIFTEAESTATAEVTDASAVSEAAEEVIHAELLSESSTISVEKVEEETETATAVAEIEGEEVAIPSSTQVEISGDLEDTSDAEGTEAAVSEVAALSDEFEANSSSAVSLETVETAVVWSPSFATIGSDIAHASDETLAAEVTTAVEIEVAVETTGAHIQEQFIMSAEETETADESVEVVVIAEVESADVVANEDVADEFITEAAGESVQVEVSTAVEETVEVAVEVAVVDVAEEADTTVAATSKDEHPVFADQLIITEVSETSVIEVESEITPSNGVEIEASEESDFDPSSENDAAADESATSITKEVDGVETATPTDFAVEESSTDGFEAIETAAQDDLAAKHEHVTVEAVAATSFEAVGVEDFEVESAEGSTEVDSESLEANEDTEIITVAVEQEHAVASAEHTESAQEIVAFDEQVIDSALFTVAVEDAETLEEHADLQEAEAVPVGITQSTLIGDGATDVEREVSQNLADAFDAVEDESGDELDDDIDAEVQLSSEVRLTRGETGNEANIEEERTDFQTTSSNVIATSEKSSTTVSEQVVETSVALEENPPASQEKRPMLTTERSFVMDDDDFIETEDTVVVGERFSTDGEEKVADVSKKASGSTIRQAASTKTTTMYERKLSVSRTKTNDEKSSAAPVTRPSKPPVDIAVRHTTSSAKKLAEAKARVAPATATATKKAFSSFGKIETKPAVQTDASAPARPLPRKAAVPVQSSPAPRRPSIAASTVSSAANTDNDKPERSAARKRTGAPEIAKPGRQRAATKTKPVDPAAPSTPVPARRTVLKQRSQSSDSRDITEVKRPEWKSNHVRVQSRVKTGTAADISRADGNNQNNSPSENPVVDRRKSFGSSTRKTSVSKPAAPSLVSNRRSTLTNRNSLSERSDFDNVGRRSEAREKREARIGSSSSSSSSTDSPDPFALALEKSSRKTSRDETIPRYLDYQNSPTYMRHFQQQLERRKRLEEINAMKSEERQKALRAYFAEKQQQTYQSQEEELRRGSEQHEYTQTMKDKERAAERALRREKSRSRHAHTAQTSSSDDAEFSTTKSMQFESTGNQMEEVSTELVVEREAELKTSIEIEEVSVNNREVIEEEVAVLAEVKQSASVGVDEAPEAST